MNKIILKQLSKKHWIELGILLIYMSGYNVLISILMQKSLEAIEMNNSKLFINIIIVFLLGSVLYGWVYYRYNNTLEKLKMRISELFAVSLIKNQLNQHSLKEDALKTGEFITLLQYDVDNISNYLIYGFFPGLNLLLTIGIALVYLFSQSIIFACVYAVLGTILFGIAYYFHVKEGVQREHFMKAVDEQRRFYEETYQNRPVIALFGGITWIFKKHDFYYQQLYGRYRSVMHLSSVNTMLVVGGVYAVSIGSLLGGMYLVTQNVLQFTSLLGIWNAGIGSIFYPLMGLPAIMSYLAGQKSSVKRLSERIGETVNLDSENVSEKIEGPYTIIGQNISYSYTEQPVIKSLDFSIPMQQLTYILGKNGSGKSTLMKVILEELIPDTGKIEFFNTRLNQVVSKSNVKIAYVPTQVELLNISLYDNLTFGKKYAQDEIEKILSIVNLNEFIPLLDKVVGCDLKVSYGQAKRLSIARALLSRSDFIFLDEPFSDIDHDSQKQLMNVLEDLADSLGIIIITHVHKWITPNNVVIRMEVDEDA